MHEEAGVCQYGGFGFFRSGMSQEGLSAMLSGAVPLCLAGFGEDLHRTSLRRRAGDRLARGDT